MISPTLAVALLLAGAYGVALVLLLAVVLRVRSARDRTRREAGLVAPAIASAVADFAAGGTDTSRIRAYFKDHRGELETCLLQYHSTLSGDGRSRLADLALELGLVHGWCEDAQSRSLSRRGTALSRLAMVAEHEPSRRLSGDILRRALKDSNRDIRLAAARTLVHSCDVDEISEVFHVAVEQNLIVRVVLADELRRHASSLCNVAVPAVLRSENTEHVLAALEILAAWERAVPLPQVTKLVEHRDQRVRLRALRVLHLIPAARESAEAVHRALCDDDERIATAAAFAAGRMKLESALVPLARCLRRGRPELARAAAAALAGLHPRGWQTLEELSNYSDPITASAALEALERARKSILGT